MERKLSSSDLMFEGIPFIQCSPFEGRDCSRCGRGQQLSYEIGCNIRNRQTGKSDFYCMECSCKRIPEYFQEIDMDQAIVMKCTKCGKCTAGVDAGKVGDQIVETSIIEYDCQCPKIKVSECPCDNCDC